MKIICLGTFKGGVGKTMSAFNLAGILAERGKKVLALDMDAQGNLTNNIGIDRTEENFKSVKDILEHNIKFEDVIIKSPIKELKNLDVIGSSFYLIETEIRLMNRANRENILKNYIEDNKDKFNEYDYVILDTNPSMSIINQNAFACSDSICLVADADLNAIEGIQLFQALWDNIRRDLRIEDNIKSIIINKYDKRLNICKDFMDFCNEDNDIKNLVCKNVIPRNVKLQECVLEAKPINLYDKKCAGYSAYKKLIDELRERGVL
ncbi:ParA family protein (plasmid) [Haloimpatiens sp. FM7330]|uniref:ParA family protein n=1 Tax=Haloimpatiens sp. FM7330 TaxID=3298610 RepID=UPI00362BE88F